MAKSKKNKNKAKLNLTVRDEQRNKLEQMAALENRSVSNLIEVMAMNAGSDWPSSRALPTLRPSQRRWTLTSTWTIQQTARNCAGQFSILSPGENLLSYCSKNPRTPLRCILTVPNLTPEIFQSSQDFGELRFADSVEGQYRLMKIIVLKTALMLGAIG